MEATLDQSGRIELPKEFRDGLVRKEGALVFAGDIEGDLSEAVQRDRDDRLRKVSGLG
jgi:DNA-binding transcriptional regulator/RsmH inhibitor MraZ